MKKRFMIKCLLYLAFVALVFFSPAFSNAGYGMNERIGAAVGGAFMCFASAPLGRFIAVKIFHCKEWDRC